MSSGALIFALGFLAAYWFSIVMHELGHVVFGRLAGFQITSFGLGMLAPVAVVQIRGIRFFVCRKFVLSGLTLAFHPPLFFRRNALITFVAGGVVFNTALCIISAFLAISLNWGHSFWLILCFINGLLAVTSLIPIRASPSNGGLSTDGMTILNLLMKGVTSTPERGTIARLDWMRPMLVKLADHDYHRVCLAESIEVWLLLRDLEKASTLLDEALALPPSDWPGLRGVISLVQAEFLSASGQQTGSIVHAKTAQSEFDLGGSDLAQFMATELLFECELTRDMGAVGGGSQTTLQYLIDHPPPPGYPHLERAHHSAMIRIATQLRDRNLYESNLAAWRIHEKRSPVPLIDLRIHHAAARWEFDLARRDSMIGYARRTLSNIEAVARTLTVPDEHASFLSRFASEIEDCQTYLAESDQPGEFEAWTARVSDPNAIARQSADEAEARNRRRKKLGARLTLFNLTCFVACVLFGPGFQAPGGKTTILLILGLMVSLSISGIYSLMVLLLGRFAPTIRANYGTMLILLGLLGWISFGLLEVLELLK